jgi:hypothetical protein
MTLRQNVASTSQPSSVLVCAPHYNMQIRDMCSVYVKMTSLIRFIQLINIMQEYDSKCLKMYLINITLNVFKICEKIFVPITKVNKG